MNDTPGIPDPTSIGSWPSAVVAVVLIVAILVVPSVLTYLGNQRTKAIQTTLTQNNGGSTVKDSQDRIERGVKGLHDKLTDEVIPQLEDQGTRIAALEDRDQHPPVTIRSLFKRGQ